MTEPILTLRLPLALVAEIECLADRGLADLGDHLDYRSKHDCDGETDRETLAREYARAADCMNRFTAAFRANRQRAAKPPKLCSLCGSDDIGFDATVDQNDELISHFEAYDCRNCGEESPLLYERDDDPATWGALRDLATMDAYNTPEGEAPTEAWSAALLRLAWLDATHFDQPDGWDSLEGGAAA